jgi:hypothetical protein
MNSKAKGSRNERRTLALLEAAGYRCMKSGASLGAWDVIGIGPKDFLVCQVKSNGWPRPAEMKTLKSFPVPGNCVKLVHRWDDRIKEPRIKVIE